MNCKQGDLAIIIDQHPANPNSAGVLCDVLYAAPVGDLVLPNGVPGFCSTANRWVIKLHGPVMVRWFDGIMREATYAVCPDNKLRPIRDSDGEDETLSWAPVPHKEVA